MVTFTLLTGYVTVDPPLTRFQTDKWSNFRFLTFPSQSCFCEEGKLVRQPSPIEVIMSLITNDCENQGAVLRACARALRAVR